MEKCLIELGLSFFNTFIFLSPARQVDGLFSGCYNILENDTDIKDYLKKFSISLTNITNIKSYSYICYSICGKVFSRHMVLAGCRVGVDATSHGHLYGDISLLGRRIDIDTTYRCWCVVILTCAWRVYYKCCCICKSLDFFCPNLCYHAL